MGGKQTHKNVFTEAQVEQLRTNPNVLSISRSTIKFTPEFKQRFYTYRQNGIDAREIFKGCGISPEILGYSRIDGFCYSMNKQGKQEWRFTDRRQDDEHQPSRDALSSTEKRLRQLEHELAYTRQEVEFLKKLQMANTEARKSWELKHQPK